ncbi:MAG: heme ABC transporter permease [Alphaproteobacteria bacterium]|nr:heme ABC transporter permease [Alphaproteobacteria bacterium SS10]
MHRFANPARFQRISRVLQPIFGLGALGLIGVGLYLSLFASPPDYQQGDTVRIMYVHVPAAWWAMGIYSSMAMAAIAGYVWRHPLADLYMRAAAPVGAAFTALCLITGAIWGQPIWGVWWVWDARLTSVLILFFLYLGFVGLVDAFDQPQRGDSAGRILVLLGSINLPIIKFSVDWWNTLHQPASITRLDSPAIHSSMLWPLLVMALGMLCIAAFAILMRLDGELARRRWEMRMQRRAMNPNAVAGVTEA